jgi:hypothetical protein
MPLPVVTLCLVLGACVVATESESTPVALSWGGVTGHGRALSVAIDSVRFMRIDGSVSGVCWSMPVRLEGDLARRQNELVLRLRARASSGPCLAHSYVDYSARFGPVTSGSYTIRVEIDNGVGVREENLLLGFE